MEEQSNTEKKAGISYFFYPNYKYIIFSQENVKTGKKFYKTPLPEIKGYDGQMHKGYMPVKFVTCDAPENGSIIQIKNAKEEWYQNPRDKYSIIVILTVFSYELVKKSNYTDNAVNEYNNVESDQDFPF